MHARPTLPLPPVTITRVMRVPLPSGWIVREGQGSNRHALRADRRRDRRSPPATARPPCAGRASRRAWHDPCVPVTIASTVSSCTLMLVCISAASCGGSLPTRIGWTPLWSTRHGTSTHVPSGRLSMWPRFSTLPLMTIGSPVISASMMRAAYSWLGFTSIAALEVSSFSCLSQRAICRSQRRDVFVERDVELLDQVRPVALDEPRARIRRNARRIR